MILNCAHFFSPHTIQHAYIAVMCYDPNPPPTPYDRSRGWVDSHGLMFRRLSYAVRERAWRYLNIPTIGRHLFD